MTATVSVTVNNELLLEEEFWAEAATKERFEDEEQRGNVTDEGELEADWLSEVGLGELSQQWRLGKSLPENDIGPAVLKLSLKPHQADAIRKRVRTLNATLKRKKHHRRPPDVRSFFQNDIPEHKDSSRSATPDSLDSTEFLSSDYSPPRRGESPLTILDNIVNSQLNAQQSGDELDEIVPNPLPSEVPNFVKIFAQEHPNLPPPNQIPGRNKDIFRPPRFSSGRGNSSGATEGEVATDAISGIEILNYHNVGTIYMRGYLQPKKNQFANLDTLTSLPSLAENGNRGVEINSKTYTTSTNINNTNANPQQRLGFNEELSKKAGDQYQENADTTELLDDEAYVEPSGLTRLNDLSEDDVKKLRPLLLMELTAECDYLNIQIRRKKVQKGGKKGANPEEVSNGIFGLSLETLLAKDRKLMGDHTLETPIIFDKLVTHLWKRALGEEGLLRMAGHKGKINDLRATFESSLYTEPEQVDAAMNQCSCHDVANLLKQFLRELPIPLLGFEYIDTFFDVAGQLKERSQENSLRLLVLLLPQSHQVVLRTLLQFLRDLVRHSETNKMNLKNVSLILAPNLVPTSALRSQDKELSLAATWVRLTQTLIRFGSSLFHIPSDLLSQMRQINDLAKLKRAKGKGGNASNGGKSATTNGNKVGVCSSLKVSAPQLGFPELILPVHAGTTAGDIVVFLLEEADRKAEYLEREGSFGPAAPTVLPTLGNGQNTNPSSTSSQNHHNGPVNVNNGINRRRAGPRAAAEINKSGPNLSCLLTQVTRDMALKTHSLYEIGGNIGYRSVDPRALIPSICRDNPGASWVLRCNHRHSASK